MDSDTVVIRQERPGDEDAIDTVLCQAFGQMDEAYLVRLLRTHHPAFDRRYSVAAWHGDRMVGHTLFSPARIRLLGETVCALAVAPVAVVPDWQRRGVGGQMLRFGHALGAEAGFAVAFLNGIPSYYPQHGYQACFGFASVTIDTTRLPAPSSELSPWPVRPADLPWLTACFDREWAGVSFSWQWGATLGEWTMPGANAIVWRTADGRRAAYTLGRPGGKRWHMVLAEDRGLARDAIATIKPATLGQHPAGWLATHVLGPEWAKAKVACDPAAMARELHEGALAPYLDALASDACLPGFCSWPLAFLACG